MSQAVLQFRTSPGAGPVRRRAGESLPADVPSSPGPRRATAPGRFTQLITSIRAAGSTVPQALVGPQGGPTWTSAG